MRPLRLYEHPNFKVDEKDITLASTICFVLALALAAAILVLMTLPLLLWDDHKASLSVFSPRPQYLPIRDLLSG